MPLFAPNYVESAFYNSLDLSLVAVLLFPVQASAQHLGIAISKLLLEAHGGQLLCKTNHTEEPYTEFILAIPPAESHMPVTEAQP